MCLLKRSNGTITTSSSRHNYHLPLALYHSNCECQQFKKYRKIDALVRQINPHPAISKNVVGFMIYDLNLMQNISFSFWAVSFLKRFSSILRWILCAICKYLLFSSSLPSSRFFSSDRPTYILCSPLQNSWKLAEQFRTTTMCLETFFAKSIFRCVRAAERGFCNTALPCTAWIKSSHVPLPSQFLELDEVPIILLRGHFFHVVTWVSAF